MTTAQDGGKVLSLTHRPPLLSGNARGTRFCQRLSRPQGHNKYTWDTQIYYIINSVASYMFRPPIVAIFGEKFFEGYSKLNSE